MSIPTDHPGIQAAIAHGLIRPDQLPGKGNRGRKAPVPVVEPAFTFAGGRAVWTVPLQLERVMNTGAIKRSLFGVADKHRKAVSKAIAPELLYVVPLAHRAAVLGRPVRCRLVRIGGSGEMDDDNLPVTCKWCRDAVAFFLGVEDGTRGPVRWEYGQEGGKRWGVRIELWAEG